MLGQSVWCWCWTRWYCDSLVSDWEPSDKAVHFWISQSTGQKITFAFSLQRAKNLWILKTALSLWQSSIYFAVTNCCVPSDEWIPLSLLPTRVYPIIGCHLGILIAMQVCKHIRGTDKLFQAVMLFDLYLGWATLQVGHKLSWCSYGCPQFLHANAGIVPEYRLLSLPSISFSVHWFTVIWSFDAV